MPLWLARFSQSSAFYRFWTGAVGAVSFGLRYRCWFEPVLSGFPSYTGDERGSCVEAGGGGPRSSFSHLRPRAPWAARGSARFPGNSAPVRKRARACRREIVSEDCAGEGTGKWHPTPGFLPGESHGRRSLEGYNPQGRKESDTAERLRFPFPVCECPNCPLFIKAPATLE